MENKLDKKGIKGKITNRTEVDITGKYCLTNKLLCIHSLIGKIDETGRVTLHTKERRFTDCNFVKDELMKKIAIIMDPSIHPDRAFSNPVFDKMNPDGFYYASDFNVSYDKLPSEFVIISLEKWYVPSNEDTMGVGMQRPLAHIYYEQKRAVQSNITRALLNVFNGSPNNNVIGEQKINRDNYYDIMPLEYIVLKPITPLYVKDANENIYPKNLEILKNMPFAFGYNGRQSSNDEELKNYQYIHHADNMMNYISNYQPPAQYSDNMNNSCEYYADHMQEIIKFIALATYNQATMVNKCLLKYRGNEEIWNNFQDFVTVKQLQSNVNFKLDSFKKLHRYECTIKDRNRIIENNKYCTMGDYIKTITECSKFLEKNIPYSLTDGAKIYSENNEIKKNKKENTKNEEKEKLI